MKREFNYVLVDFNDKPLTANGNTLTLATVSVEALLMPYQDEQNLSGEEKVKRFSLAKRIHGATEPIDVTAEEVSLLKRLIAKAYSPLVVGQAYEKLEQDPLTQQAA